MHGSKTLASQISDASGCLFARSKTRGQVWIKGPLASPERGTTTIKSASRTLSATLALKLSEKKTLQMTKMVSSQSFFSSPRLERKTSLGDGLSR